MEVYARHESGLLIVSFRIKHLLRWTIAEGKYGNRTFNALSLDVALSKVSGEICLEAQAAIQEYLLSEAFEKALKASKRGKRGIYDWNQNLLYFGR